MIKDFLRYEEMIDAAYRGVVREALSLTAEHGLPGNHHFYLTFKTGADGVEIPDYLRSDYPDEMTIVLEHQFWDLAVTEDAVAVTLRFKNRPERLVIPFPAITAFADPSVKFGLRFQEGTAAVPAGAKPSQVSAKPDEPLDSEPAEGKKPAEVVALDAFRKK